MCIRDRVCPLGGEGRPIVLASHVDTLGLMVRAVKPDGRLAFTCLGGPSLQAVETENVTVITRDGRRYTGVVELRNASKPVSYTHLKMGDAELKVAETAAGIVGRQMEQ